MGNLRIPKLMVLYVFELFILVQIQVSCYQFKVGDLDSWGIPSPANPQIYSFWSKSHSIDIGDSLLFLYPPSEDSVIQVTEENYNSCNLKNPILYMNNGNSVFNITSHGDFYFTSGNQGHCLKKQKLHISVGSSAHSPADSLSDSASAPSYANVFGSIPLPPSASPSSSPARIENGGFLFLLSVVAAGFYAVVNGNIM
ncbi:early nodulin-like protein 8 [Euphorbia lathyris]|uniref:early nodulin-like protein 8 n=1 Tax=Euphorbia lathyris TaxID=212925 RepID=UPI00331445E5